jgi:hypothetical protein
VGGDTAQAALAEFAEDALLKAGRRSEAYELYANQANSKLATFRAIAKNHPEVNPDKLLSILIDSTPGEKGNWFATAKSLKRFELATALAWRSTCDSKTLSRAARDHLASHTTFADEVALAALQWISMGHDHLPRGR